MPEHPASTSRSTGVAPDQPVHPIDARHARMLQQRLLDAGRQLHRSRHVLLRTLTEYDSSGHWALSGSPTCAHWAAAQLDVTVGTAREWLRIGRALAELPLIDAAFADGTLSYAKVRSLTRVAIDHPGEQTALIELAAPLAAGDLGRALARWSERNDDADDRDRRMQAAISLSIRLEVDGTSTLTLRLPTIEIERIRAAVDARVMQSSPPRGPSPTSEQATAARASLRQQRAVALAELLAGSNGTAIETEIILHVRGDGCTMHDGSPIADSAVASRVDGSFIRALIHDAARRPINASGRQRHPTVRQQRVVDERFPVCVDCGSTELLDYDHDPEFARSQRTVIDELARRCGRCHARRHGSTEPPGAPASE